jgi:CheY-like chemotaxis protein
MKNKEFLGVWILVCEDNEINIKLMSCILSKYNIKYQIAKNGK